ncbi:hypothetical protein XENOCAPTIV_000490 [Xenoophorus captivus]|uniref:Uncharacterized protein n=1 Tax=Xenoophorus captivus TaxID=1517983 RepID=A0ABV0SE78_9TELE
MMHQLRKKVCTSSPAKQWKSTPKHAEPLTYTLFVKLAVTTRHIAAPRRLDMIVSVKVAASSSLAVIANQPGRRDRTGGVWSSERRADLLHLGDIAPHTKEKWADGGLQKITHHLQVLKVFEGIFGLFIQLKANLVEMSDLCHSKNGY